MAKTVLERLKSELNNREYFADSDYESILEENKLDSKATYIKETMQKSLLYSVVDVFEMLSNDIDLMRKVDTEFETTDAAAKYLKQRIQDIRTRIASIPDVVDPEANSMFSLMFTRK